jgi:hypothetical protein
MAKDKEKPAAPELEEQDEAAAQESEAEAAPQEDPKKWQGKVKVQFLRHVGPHAPGDVAEFDGPVAKDLCAERSINDGPVPTKYRKAVHFGDAQSAKKVKLTPKQLAKLTQPELEAMGKKNVVVTPVNKELEARLASLKKQAADKPDRGPASPSAEGKF